MFAKLDLILPVEDLGRSIAFYTALGYPVAQRCSDDRCGVVAFNDHAAAILQSKQRFAMLTARELIDPGIAVEAIISLSLDSRSQVDELVDRALVSGGGPAGQPVDCADCYRRGFVDPDGHQFTVEHTNREMTFAAADGLTVKRESSRETDNERNP